MLDKDGQHQSSFLTKGAPGGDSQKAESRSTIPHSKRGETLGCIILLQDHKDFFQSSASRRRGTDSSSSCGLGSDPPRKHHLLLAGGPGGADSSQSSLRKECFRHGGRKTDTGGHCISTDTSWDHHVSLPWRPVSATDRSTIYFSRSGDSAPVSFVLCFFWILLPPPPSFLIQSTFLPC